MPWAASLTAPRRFGHKTGGLALDRPADIVETDRQGAIHGAEPLFDAARAAFDAGFDTSGRGRR